MRIRENPRNLGVGRSVMNAYEEIEDDSWVTVLPGDNEFLGNSCVLKEFLEPLRCMALALHRACTFPPKVRAECLRVLVLPAVGFDLCNKCIAEHIRP